MEQKTELGKRFDGGKTRYDLVPVDSLKAVADVYTFGATRYGDRNWELGMSWGRVYGAIQRHLNAFWGGETHDPDSGLPHLAHAAWGCLTLLAYMLRGVGNDDRDDKGQDRAVQ